jgi:universal stress protein E
VGNWGEVFFTSLYEAKVQMQIDSVLTILDKPKHEQLALARGLRLAEQAQAPLTLAAFCWHALADGPQFSAAERAAIRKRLTAERRSWQRELATTRRTDHLRIQQKTIWTDDIAGWVARETKARPGTVLVKSVHKSRTLLHTPLDWRLLRESQAPILLAQPHKRRGVRNILAALDMRHADQMHHNLNAKVMDAAATFARLFDARVHCVYAVEVSQPLRDLDIVDARRAEKGARAAAHDALQDLLDPYGIPVRAVHFPVDKVGRAVATVARKVHADLLVVGTSARRVRQRIGLGNSAERLLTKAVCDVLAVHPDTP